MTTRSGLAASPDIIPTYSCPQCAEFYVAAEVSPALAARIQHDLDVELAQARRRN